MKEDFNLEKYLEGRIEKIIPECEPEYIHVQTSLIQQYEAERDKELDKQVTSMLYLCLYSYHTYNSILTFSTNFSCENQN